MSKGSGDTRATNSRTAHGSGGSAKSGGGKYKAPDYVRPTSFQDIESGKVVITEKDARNMSPNAFHKTLEAVTERLQFLDRKRERNTSISASEQRLIETRNLMRKVQYKKANENIVI